MKKIIISAIIIIAIIIAGVYFFTHRSLNTVPVTENQGTTTSTVETQNQNLADTNKTVIGTSTENRDITAYNYGTGNTELLFVGGIHGGYEWNTVLVAYNLMDYLEANPNVIPKNVKVTVIPVLNPDGLYKVIGATGRFVQADVSTSKSILTAGRFNANDVDLNRNFDCDWQSKGVWQNTTVSGGSKVFSEKESQAIKSYIEINKPAAVVVWYSAAGGVFASNCHNGILAETRTLTNTYAIASGYKAYDSFDFYETTGDMVNWLAKKSIPAISVLLSNHEDTEWSKNLLGINALLKHYAK
ncbi:MAG: M14 family metallopeptidase [Candidatus Paceibacterota bacterium]|jgi:uncharacterized protein YxeA